MKKFTLLVLSLSLVLGSLTVSANAAGIGFTDVPEGTWFYDAVTQCANNGYVSGVGNNQFMPEGKLTYAQIFTMFANAFYKDEKQDYENDRRLEMDAYFNGSPEWWSYNAYYFMDNGLLQGAGVNIQSSASANAPITRYETVQIVTNVLTNEGITVSDSDRAAAQGRIADWNSVPANYRDAVATCFSLGIVNGYTGNYFTGTDTLTRSQACVILNNLVKAVGTGPQTSTDGVLANGKPITEENVLELLAEIEKEYPTGTLWAERTVAGTAYNPNKVSSTLTTTFGSKFGLQYGCGGFAAMVSDLVFGMDNPCRKLDDLSEIRPGDIIIIMQGSQPIHVQVAMSTPVNATNKVRVAEGNANDQVMWPSSDLPNFSRPGNNNTTWDVYTRYPA